MAILTIIASGIVADKVGRRRTLFTAAVLIAVFSGFAPTLLDGGTLGQDVFLLLGFAILGFSYGQAAGAVTSNFSSKYRYTGAALTSDLAWLVGAGFAPLTALGLSANFGLPWVSVYLLSGAACTIAALSLNRALEITGLSQALDGSASTVRIAFHEKGQLALAFSMSGSRASRAARRLRRPRHARPAQAESGAVRQATCPTFIMLVPPG